MENTLAQYRINDPVITNVVHGYAQAEAIAPFIAPAVPVTLRAGKVIKFSKEQFVAIDTRRAPGATIKRINTSYTTDNYYLDQHALAAEVTEEAYQEATNGEAKLDLRLNAANRASASVMLSWERQVIQTVTNAGLYESTCTAALSGASKFNNAGSDPEVTIQAWKEAVRAQIGTYPNSAVIDSFTYNALKFHPIFRDRIKYTSSASINLDLLATWFDLPRGIKVSQKVQLDPNTSMLSDVMPAGTFLLFFSPEAELAPGFMPMPEADRAKPSFAYTYTLDGYPIATPERFDEDRRVFVTDILVEQGIQLTGLGATSKVGAGFLGTGCV